MKKTSNRLLGTILLLGSTLVVVRSSEHRAPQGLAHPLKTIPYRINAWVGVSNPPLRQGMLEVLKPSSYLSRTYQRGSKVINLFVSYYSEQRAGESMHSPKNCLPGNGWQVWEAGEVTVNVDRKPTGINKYVVQKGSERMLVLYWYQTPHRVIASEYLGKVCLVWDSIARGHTAGSLVRLALPDSDSALAEGMSFAEAVIDEMQVCLGS